MALKIYNSLTRRKETFIPVEEGKVKMYVCGMTVYSDTHVGHARTYLAFDVIRRYFEYKGYAVKYVQNITDVDDKIIAAATKKGVDPLEYSNQYSKICLQALDDLGIRRADIYTKASETIPDMVSMITNLIAKDYAYETDGDVYFSVEKFKEYGKLSGQQPEEMKSGARISPGEKKRNPLDFALWKKAKPTEPSWESPWGLGRPGWHIECSVMSSKYLGLPFDIHGGGMDLQFPHHENEIAQAEAATGKPFARFWLHVGLLTIDGEKMSKSLGNILNVTDIIKKWDPEIIRTFFAMTHYRSPPDFNEQTLYEVKKSLNRIHRTKHLLEKNQASSNTEFNKDSLSVTEQQYYRKIFDFENEFETAMDDDFNTPKAFASLFEFIRETNRFLAKTPSPLPSLCSYALLVLEKIGYVFTLFQPSQKESKKGSQKEIIQQLISYAQSYDINIIQKDIKALLTAILQRREKARKEKDWSTADAIRGDLEALGYDIQDTDEGPIWRKK